MKKDLSARSLRVFALLTTCLLLFSCATKEALSNDVIAGGSSSVTDASGGDGTSSGDPLSGEPSAEDPAAGGSSDQPSVSGDPYPHIPLESMDMVLVSCQGDSNGEASQPQSKATSTGEQPDELDPSFVPVQWEAESTKTYLDASNNIFWSEGDRLKIYYADGASNYTVSTIKHGDVQESTFDALVDKSADYYYAFYPEGLTATMTNIAAKGAFEIVIPSEQDGRFENCHLAVGKASAEGRHFAFKNVGSYMKITVASTSATAITLQATNSEDKIVGTLVAPFTDDAGTLGELTLKEGTGASSVTVNLPEGRTGATTVYIALLPGVNFSKGFRLRYEYGDGQTHPGYAYSKSDGRSIARRGILNVKTLDDRIKTDWFVKTSGTYSDADASGAGSSWDKALNVTGLADLLAQPLDGSGNQDDYAAFDRAWMLDGANIHIAAGEYDLAAAVGASALKMEYTLYANPVRVNLFGAYPAGASGTSTAVRDTSSYETAFKGGSDKGVFLLGNQTDLRLDGFTIRDAALNSSAASALKLSPGATGTARLKATSCRFMNNSNGNSYTGAACYLSKCTAELDKCTFSGNYARNASCVEVNNGSLVTLRRCTFSGNSTHNTSGAVQNEGGTLNAENCLFENNACAVTDTTMYGGGGAFHANGEGSVSNFADCVFTGNTAKNGGAISLQNATVTCTRCNFSGNQAWKNKGKTGTYFGLGDKRAGGAAYLNNANAVLELNDCDLTENSAPYACGGAVAVNNAAARLTVNAGTDFSENYCWREGGAVNSVGTLTIEGSAGSKVTFRHNYTTHASQAMGNGGALLLDVNSQSSLSYADFSDNISGSGSSNKYSNGGGISANGAKSFSASHCGFSGHLARNGGGVYLNRGNVAAGTCYFTDCSFTENYCDDTNPYFDATIASCNFHGAGACVTGVNAVFTRCQFEDNRSYNGAGALHINNASSNVQCEDCTFSGNTVGSASGGAVILEAGSFTADGTTFTQNAANIGGAIYSYQDINLGDCIFDGNTATSGGSALYASENLTITGTDTLKCAVRNHSNTGVSPIQIGTSSALSFTHCKFEGNSVVNPSANGGLFPLGNNVFSATDCVFVGNSVSGSGRLAGVVAALNTAGSGSITLTRTSIRDCSGSNNGGALYLAGGVTASPSLTIVDSELKGNSCSGYGGAINSTVSDAQTYSISGTTFKGNTTVTCGGAIHLNGGGGSRNVTLTDCLFEDNRQTSSAGAGAGAINFGNGTLLVRGCTFRGNKAANDAGGAIKSPSSGATVSLTIGGSDEHPETLFSGNESTRGVGGAIGCTADAAVASYSFSDCLFETNTSASHGGALYFGPAQALTLTDCGFSENAVTGSGAYGDAIAYISGTGLTLTGTAQSKNYVTGHTSTYPIHSPATTTYTFDNLEFSGNETTLRNGCMLNLSTKATFAISNSSIHDNSAPHGGAIFADLPRYTDITTGTGNCTISNTSLENNTATAADGKGGAIYWNCVSWTNNVESGTPMLKINNSSRLNGNKATMAGSAIWLGVGRVYLNGATLSGNTFASLTAHEDDSYGGTIYIGSNFSKLDIVNCTLSDNSADSKGGAVNISGGRVFMTNCTCNGNSAYSRGGAIFLRSEGFLLARKCTFVGNYVTKSNAWGSFLHGNNANFYSMFLNCTIDDGPTARTTATVNGSINLMLVNSTFIGNTSGPVLRVENNKNGLLLNNIILNRGGGTAVFHNGNYTWSSYGGYNILGTVDQNGKTVSNIPGGRPGDQTDKTEANLGSWLWNEGGYYTWDGKVGGVATQTPAINPSDKDDYVSVGMASGFSYSLTFNDEKDLNTSVNNLGNQVLTGWAGGEYYFDRRGDASMGDRRNAGNNYPGSYAPDVASVQTGGGGSYESAADRNENTYVY